MDTLTFGHDRHVLVMCASHGTDVIGGTNSCCVDHTGICIAGVATYSSGGTHCTKHAQHSVYILD